MALSGGASGSLSPNGLFLTLQHGQKEDVVAVKDKPCKNLVRARMWYFTSCQDSKEQQREQKTPTRSTTVPACPTGGSKATMSQS